MFRRLPFVRPRRVRDRRQPVVDELRQRHEVDVGQDLPLPARPLQKEVALQPVPRGHVPHDHARPRERVLRRAALPLLEQPFRQPLQPITPEDIHLKSFPQPYKNLDLFI